MTESLASYNSFSSPLRFIAIVTRSISNLKAKEPSCYSHRFPFANSFLVTSYVISRRTVLLRFLARPFSRVSRYNRFFGKRKLKRVGLFDRLIQNRFVRLNDRMNNSVPRNVRVSQPWNERNSSNVIKHLLLPFFFLFFFFFSYRVTVYRKRRLVKKEAISLGRVDGKAHAKCEISQLYADFMVISIARVCGYRVYAI